MKDILSELKVTKLNSGDEDLWFVMYKGDVFIVNEGSDLMKLHPYFEHHPQLEKSSEYGDPFNVVNDFFEFMSRMSELAPDVMVGRISLKYKTMTLDSRQSFSPSSSLLLKKLVKQLGIKKVYANVLKYDGEEQDVEYSRKKILGDVPAIVYHGTTSKYMEDILVNGLRPGQAQGNWINRGVRNDNEIFFAADLNTSEFYAHYAKQQKGGIPIVFEMGIPDKDLLKPDFDADTASTKKQYYKHNPSLGIAKTDMKPMTVSREQGKWGYSGRIPATFIRWVYMFREHDKKWIKLKPTTVKKIMDNYGIDGFYKYGIMI